MAKLERAELILTVATEGFWDWDLKADTAYLSPRYCELTGYPPDTLFDSNFFRTLIHPDDADQVFKTMAEHLQGKRDLSVIIYRMISRDGTVRWIEGRGKVVEYDASGVPVRMVGTILDVSERKNAEEAAKRLAKHQIVMEDELRKGIAVELHDDIAQELAALGFNLTHIERYLTAPLRSKLSAVLADSRSLVKRISHTVRNLMARLHPTLLDQLGMAEALQSYANSCTQRSGVPVTVQIAPELPALSPNQKTVIFHIAQEALNNAMKHGCATRVSITLSHGDSRVRLAVTDDGKGFEPDSMGVPQPGQGWGLAIMRERAEMIDGIYQVTSAPGNGTTIALEFKVPSHLPPTP
jgi:PAS domain S-box-containing protein